MTSPRRRHFLKTLSGSAAGALASANQAAPQAAPQTRPNILIVMADQHRAGLTKRSGFPIDTMPALDRLAASGVAFDRAYTTAPLCVPARESLLTGRWPHAHRVRQNSAARFAYFDKDLFHVTKELGYRTALVGKNHSHLTPERVDFWRPYMHSNGYIPDPPPKDYVEFDRWMGHLNHGTGQQATPFPLELQFPYRIVSNAIEFVDSSKDQPFAMWVSFPEPHNPYQVPTRYFGMFPPDRVPGRDWGPEALRRKGFKWNWLRQLENDTYPGYDDQWRRTRSNYLGMLRLIDDQIARLLNHLESTGKLMNTIIVYLTDHGDFFCDYGLIRKGVDLPEVLTRIPMVWSGWGIRAQTDHPAFVSTADIFPTLCEALGAMMPVGTQGRSLWPLLQGKDYPQREFESIFSEVGFGGMDYGPGDEIEPRTGRTTGPSGAISTFDELNSCTQSGNMKMVRWGDWKLTFNRVGVGELFNVVKDPYELNNLYTDKEAAPVREHLTTELLRWTIRTQDDLPVAAYKARWPNRNWEALYRNKG